MSYYSQIALLPQFWVFEEECMACIKNLGGKLPCVLEENQDPVPTLSRILNITLL